MQRLVDSEFNLWQLRLQIDSSERILMTDCYLNFVKSQLESEMRQLDLQPRPTVAQKRIALGKLSKDFDRLRGTLSAITNECNAIQVSAVSEPGGFFRNGGGDTTDNGKQQMNQLQLVQTLQGTDVDEAIQRERERDLKKINQDLAMVNEMFK